MAEACRQLLPDPLTMVLFLHGSMLESTASRTADRAVLGVLGNDTTRFLIVPGSLAQSLLL